MCRTLPFQQSRCQCAVRWVGDQIVSPAYDCMTWDGAACCSPHRVASLFNVSTRWRDLPPPTPYTPLKRNKTLPKFIPSLCRILRGRQNLTKSDFTTGTYGNSDVGCKSSKSSTKTAMTGVWPGLLRWLRTHGPDRNLRLALLFLYHFRRNFAAKVQGFCLNVPLVDKGGSDEQNRFEFLH